MVTGLLSMLSPGVTTKHVRLYNDLATGSVYCEDPLWAGYTI